MHDDLTIDRRIDRLCLEFEDGLRRGRGQSIETYLDRVAPESRERLFRELLLLELDYSKPPPQPGAILRRFPDYEPTVRECLRLTRVVTPQRLHGQDRVGRYVVHELLGEGTYGDVYKAWDEELRRWVALKSPRLGNAATGASVEAFRREATSLASLRHEHIVRIYDVQSDANGWPLLVLEYVDGQPLSVATEPRKLVAHLIDVARAIDYVHQRGFVHRDLKPDNILIDSDGRAVVTDFGLSVHADAQRELAGESAGTIRYMSPELVRGESHWVDGRTDVWSLGVILYESLAGVPPFRGDDVERLTDAILTRPAKPPRQSRSSCPPELERICLKCLEKAPEKRYATARDLARALQDHQTGRAPGGRRRRALVAGLIVACAGLLWGILWLSFLGPRSMGEDMAAAPASAPAARQMAAVIDVTVVRDGAAGRALLPLADAVPLREGDWLEISIETDRPARLWVIWMDTDGTVTPLSPWTDGDWSTHPATQEAVTELYLPPAWTLVDARTGSATLLVLGATPDSELEPDVKSLLRGWQAQPAAMERELHFDFGRLDPSVHRGGLEQDRERQAPVLQNQRLFRGDPFRSFSLCRSICIPVRGEP